MWQDESVFYQIYPIGFCGAPRDNDGNVVNRLKKISGWADYFCELGINAVLLNPVFQSDRHGYDTRDYAQIDCRLGTNKDFAKLCAGLRKRGIRVILDGVFNHAGRGFWAFRDVLKNREASPYKDWFYIRFDQNNAYNDGFNYEGWEGHFNLVRLNLKNRDVVNHLLQCVRGWIEEFDIDGLRLDVAYCVDKDFMKELRDFCSHIKQDFFLMGEMLFGDYRQIVNDTILHSCTNYECYKGVHSSFNDLNMFEISYSLHRQFGPDSWTIYKGLHLFNFIDNHDVSRIASILKNKRHVPLVYALLFGMPGIPCIYYGSEWGMEGDKQQGDDALRPSIDSPVSNDLSNYVAKLISIRKNSKALCYGNYKNIVVTNRQFIFERSVDGERIRIAINADEAPYQFNNFNTSGGSAVDLLTGKQAQVGNGYVMEPYGAAFWKMG